MKNHKTLIATFYELSYALRALHQGSKPRLDELHDVWLKGAVTPHSRVRDPKHFDPRKQQAGNVEARICLPTPLSTWIQQNAARIGVQMTPEIALQLMDRIALGLSGDATEFVYAATIKD